MESFIAGNGGGSFYAVPEGCIATIVAFTTPRDACRLAAVSKLFKSASESDVVWERFLAPDCELIVARSDGGVALTAELESKKQLYMHLSSHPLLVDDATKSFWLEQSSGKKCWVLSARSLSIVWTCTPRYWKWTSDPESRFPEVAELLTVCWLEIGGKIQTSMLSLETHYAAYLVYKLTEESYGLSYPSEALVITAGGKTESRPVYLSEEHLLHSHRLPSRGVRGLGSPPFDESQGPRIEVDQVRMQRPDGWQEVKIGDFFTHLGDEDEIELKVMEVKGGNWKHGLVVEGIEIRPVGAKQ